MPTLPSTNVGPGRKASLAFGQRCIGTEYPPRQESLSSVLWTPDWGFRAHDGTFPTTERVRTAKLDEEPECHRGSPRDSVNSALTLALNLAVRSSSRGRPGTAPVWLARGLAAIGRFRLCAPVGLGADLPAGRSPAACLPL